MKPRIVFYGAILISSLLLGGLFYAGLFYFSKRNVDITSTIKPTLTTPHIKTPHLVRAVYISSWVATLKQRRENIIKFVERTEINAVVIDIKDYSGLILFDTRDPELKKFNTEENRIKDIREWISDLHQRGIYVIARLTVFQDPLYATQFPDQAVQTKEGTVWKDRKGLSFVDVSARPFWDYILRIAAAAEKAGFDEINFDYIRFPSDGNMANIQYPLSGNGATQRDPRLFSDKQQWALAGTTINVTLQDVQTTIATLNAKLLISTREQKLEAFFQYLQTGMKKIGIPSSADVFGMVSTNKDDLGIGQVLESTLPYFDFVCPMVYPSHYPKGFLSLSNPAQHPYKVIHYSMEKAAKRAQVIHENPLQLRPWIQDFSLGTPYKTPEIHAQKKAIYDAGLNSYLVWDPRVQYTKEAYSPSQNETAPLIDIRN